MHKQYATQAILSSNKEYTIFNFGRHTIRFRTSPRLERYTAIKEWDHGYLVVSAKYKGIPADIEEYIDLVPILNNLCFDTDKVLSHIENVRIQYE